MLKIEIDRIEREMKLLRYELLVTLRQLYPDDYMSDALRIEYARRSCILTGDEYRELKILVAL